MISVQDTVPEMQSIGQHHAVASHRPDGTYLVTWIVEDIGVYFSIYEADHTPRVEAVELASPAAKPSATLSADGWFIAMDSQTEIQLCEISADGEVLVAPFAINSVATETGVGGRPDVAALSDGGLVVVWDWSQTDPDVGGIYYRRFDEDLVPRGDDVLFAVLEKAGSPADAASLPDGGFVVSWVEPGAELVWLTWFDDQGDQIDQQRLDEGSDPLIPGRPNVDTNAAGEIAVTWRLGELGGEQHSFGSLLSPQHQTLAMLTLGEAEDAVNRPDVAILGSTAVFAWEDAGTGDVYIQAFDAHSGAAITAPYTPPVDFDGAQGRPSVSMYSEDDGVFDVVLIWEHFLLPNYIKIVDHAGLELRRPHRTW